jgi:hypothetical protein
VFWVISVYFTLGNILPKSGTFLPGHPVYICSAWLIFNAYVRWKKGINQTHNDAIVLKQRKWQWDPWLQLGRRVQGKDEMIWNDTCNRTEIAEKWDACDKLMSTWRESGERKWKYGGTDRTCNVALPSSVAMRCLCVLFGVCYLVCAVWCVLFGVCCLVCYLMCAVWCVLFGVCYLVCVVWCVLFDVCCLVCDVWCVLFGVCCLVCAIWCVLFGVCYLLCAVWCMLFERHWFFIDIHNVGDEWMWNNDGIMHYSIQYIYTHRIVQWNCTCPD